MACGALICAGAVIIATVKSKPKLEIVAKKVDEPQAITEVVARTPNLNNVHYEPSLEKDENGEFIQVPVPRGYVASGVDDERYVNGVTENGVRVHSGGFVIYEGTEPVTSENLDEAQKTRNQYVWVPIDSKEADRMYFKNTDGQIYGNYYTFNMNGYTLSRSPRTSDLREPGLVTSSDYDHAYLKQYMEGISSSDFLQEMKEEFYEMIVSIKTYGGFYIGRYETGNINLKVPVVRKGNKDIRYNVNWYRAYKACKNLKGTNKVVYTGIIWEIQWDETLKWLIDTNEKSARQVGVDSSSWGNYVNATFTYTDENGVSRTKSGNVIIPTGSTEYTRANNIYDLAGNVYEYNMGTTGSGRFLRGGYPGYTGSELPAAYAPAVAPEKYDNYWSRGSRTTLRLE